MKKPSMCILDIETTHDIIATYGLKKQYHSPDSILNDWFIICFCWKWVDGSRIYQASILDDMKAFNKDHFDDEVVVRRLHELLQDVEIVIGHNVHKFDWGKFYARVMYHNLTPIAEPLFVDTLKEAKKIARFTSNSMRYLAKYLKIAEKKKHSPDMFMRILKGDKSAIKECIEYCKGDIETSEAMYKRMLPHMKNHPNMNLWRGDGIECCTNCCHEDFKKDGFRYTKVGKFQRYSCRSCGHPNIGTKRIKGARIK